MLRTFPKEMLKKIPADIIEEFYARKGVEEAEEADEESCICCTSNSCDSNKQEKAPCCEETWAHTAD